tara:strand:- start:2777 stop:2971 length:195 start_codon:yes stop_codon:yes gene_type:complete
MSKAVAFKSRFKDVDLNQKSFSETSVKAVKEIFAEKTGMHKHNIKYLDFSKCLKGLRILKNREQ